MEVARKYLFTHEPQKTSLFRIVYSEQKVDLYLHGLIDVGFDDVFRTIIQLQLFCYDKEIY